MRRLFLALALCLFAPTAVVAQDLQSILQTHADEVADPGRRSVGVVIDDLLAAGLPNAPDFLAAWQDRDIVRDTADGRFYRAGRTSDGQITLIDLDTGAETMVPEDRVEEVRPNGGVRPAR